MRKLFTLFLALAASIGTMFASDTQENGIWYDFDTSTKTASVTYRGSSYSSYSNRYSGDIVIPASVTYSGTTYSVTSIGDYAFYKCSDLTSITIPNSVTSIGNAAFFKCTGLTSVTIPNSVTSIGMGAFESCTGLTSPVCNAHVFAFMPTTYSGAYTIPEGIESIAGVAFLNCSSLTSVTIPNSVTSIGAYAFQNCTGLTSVTIPNSVTSIGKLAFYGCSGLTSITIGNSVTTIEDAAFCGCSGLTSITCEVTTPPTCGVSAFEEVPKSIPLYVPFGSEDAYQYATGWNYFDNIQPIKADNVDITTTEVVPDETSVFFRNGQLFILRDGKTYSITGQEVK